MIGFRDDTPTYEETAQTIAKEWETLNEIGDCRVCGHTEDDCNRYYQWCIGRSCRLSKDVPGWRAQVVAQIELIVERVPSW
jgi:hypothetical protein